VELLADENIDPEIIDWLRQLGHNVLSVRESHRGISDEAVLSIAGENRHILLTADKDFGDLTIRRSLPVRGVILLRLHTSSRQDYLNLFKVRWVESEQRVAGNFITMGNKKSRVRPLR
jgi:predicted nuclease of predicted toxin-antitoxin system